MCGCMEKLECRYGCRWDVCGEMEDVQRERLGMWGIVNVCVETAVCVMKLGLCT